MQEIKTVGQKSRSSAHPLSRWSTSRAKKRGLRTGYGNLGRYSKPAVKDWKRKTKVTKRITVMFKCKECKKSKIIKKSIRSSRIEVGEKVAK